MIRFQPTLPQGYWLVLCESIGSTNDEAKRLARNGAPEGTLVWALEQTVGRGRRGRVWVSRPGNLYASLILGPRCSIDQAAQLGFVAALAVGAHAYSHTGPLRAGWSRPKQTDLVPGKRQFRSRFPQSVQLRLSD